MLRHLAILSVLACLPHNRSARRAQGPDDEELKKIPSKDLRCGKDELKRYFLMGPEKTKDKDAKPSPPPAAGYGLFIIMPGGDGSAEFQPFVKRIFKEAIPEGYLVAQPVAPQVKKDQNPVWPTKNNKVPGIKFTTEEFIAEMAEEIGKSYKLRREHIFSLSWSSSGPAAYAMALEAKPVVAGSFIAMSIFHANELPNLKIAKDRRFYLLHSPDDKTCPYSQAVEAKDALMKAGAKVTLVDYAGGHGWTGPVYDWIRTGVQWLESAGTSEKPGAQSKPAPK